LAELKRDAIIRFSWDHISTEPTIRQAIGLLFNAGIKARQVRAYVLVGFSDTPASARYRLEVLYHEFGIWPNAQGYRPLNWLGDTKKLDWFDNPEYQRLLRYWNRLRFVRQIPYDEFDNKARGRDKDQGVLDLA
jgi:hypothetical protein